MMLRQWNRRALRATLVAAVWLSGGAAQACETQASHTATVAHVIDGQTLRLGDGSEVRLTGVLPPQTPPWWKGEGAWPLAGAARRALERLALGQRVELRFAVNEERRDRHERFLAHLFVLRDEERIWVQGSLIAQGFARAASFAGHRACARTLQARERAARDTKKGLWRAGRFRVLRAADETALIKRRGQFQIVEGRVHKVTTARAWTFLNFAPDWKRDFTVAIRAGERRSFQDSDVPLDRLEGKRVRVRGWIERWNGPVIKATHPEQIEVLEENAAQ